MSSNNTIHRIEFRKRLRTVITKKYTWDETNITFDETVLTFDKTYDVIKI